MSSRCVSAGIVMEGGACLESEPQAWRVWIAQAPFKHGAFASNAGGGQVQIEPAKFIISRFNGADTDCYRDTQGHRDHDRSQTACRHDQGQS